MIDSPLEENLQETGQEIAPPTLPDGGMLKLTEAEVQPGLDVNAGTETGVYDDNGINHHDHAALHEEQAEQAVKEEFVQPEVPAETGVEAIVPEESAAEVPPSPQDEATHIPQPTEDFGIKGMMEKISQCPNLTELETLENMLVACNNAIAAQKQVLSENITVPVPEAAPISEEIATVPDIGTPIPEVNPALGNEVVQADLPAEPSQEVLHHPTAQPAPLPENTGEVMAGSDAVVQPVGQLDSVITSLEGIDANTAPDEIEQLRASFMANISEINDASAEKMLTLVNARTDGSQGHVKEILAKAFDAIAEHKLTTRVSEDVFKKWWEIANTFSNNNSTHEEEASPDALPSAPMPPTPVAPEQPSMPSPTALEAAPPQDVVAPQEPISPPPQPVETMPAPSVDDGQQVQAPVAPVVEVDNSIPAPVSPDVHTPAPFVESVVEVEAQANIAVPVEPVQAAPVQEMPVQPVQEVVQPQPEQAPSPEMPAPVQAEAVVQQEPNPNGGA